eukprot:765035-Hanusia_phi.AAC.7
MLGPKVARVFIRKRRGESNEGDQLAPSQKEILISNETIESLLHLRQADAANQLGISLTALKNACKYLGFENWPTARSNLMASQPAGPALPSLTSRAQPQSVTGRDLEAWTVRSETGGGARLGRVDKRSGSEGSIRFGREEKRKVLAASLPALRSHELEELMLDALEHVAEL